MSLNLIEDAWIPVRRRDGTTDTIRPADVVDFGPAEDNPPVALDAVRPDFNGTLIQFLVGLFQTLCAPEHERDWRRWLRERPSADDLHEIFAEYSRAFEFEGDGPRFMQDFETLEASSTKPVSYLLVDTPTGQTLKKNSDHFTKNRDDLRFCPVCTALSLLTLQLNAPGGGRGYRTSLRGGGPLSTIVLGDNLWQTTWVNVLPTENFKRWTDPSARDEADIFPWMGPTRTSEKKGGSNTTPENVHPAQVFWATPRRVDLSEPSKADGRCSLCGKNSERLFRDYTRKAYGVNYEGAWKHPLTPHSTASDGRPNPAKGQLGGLTYRHWEGYVVDTDDGGMTPAGVVQQFWNRFGRYANLADLFSRAPRMWAFGFDADNMKIRSWHESEMPLFFLAEEIQEKFENFSRRLISAADKIAYQLGLALKNGLYGTPETTSKGNIKWNVADGVSRSAHLFKQAEDQFWHDTEDDFYDVLQGAVDTLEANDSSDWDDALDELKRDWADRLNSAALHIFDRISQFGEFQSVDPKAVALARRDLDRNSNYRRNSKLRERLHLQKLPETVDTAE